MTSTAVRMSRVDTAWLRMDSPSNLMMIVGFWTISPRVDYETVCERIEERMLKYPRFRQRVVQDQVITISCIDNLVKGASGAALQNFNLMHGYPETMALL